MDNEKYFKINVPNSGLTYEEFNNLPDSEIIEYKSPYVHIVTNMYTASTQFQDDYHMFIDQLPDDEVADIKPRKFFLLYVEVH